MNYFSFCPDIIKNASGLQMTYNQNGKHNLSCWIYVSIYSRGGRGALIRNFGTIVQIIIIAWNVAQPFLWQEKIKKETATYKSSECKSYGLRAKSYEGYSPPGVGQISIKFKVLLIMPMYTKFWSEFHADWFFNKTMLWKSIFEVNSYHALPP